MKETLILCTAGCPGLCLRLCFPPRKLPVPHVAYYLIEELFESAWCCCEVLQLPVSSVLRSWWRAVCSMLNVFSLSTSSPLFSPVSLGIWSSLVSEGAGDGHKHNYYKFQPLPGHVGFRVPSESLGYTLSLLRTLPGPLGLTIWKMGDLLREEEVLRGEIRCSRASFSPNPAGF